MLKYKIIQLSESALLVSFGNEINLELHIEVMNAKALLESKPFTGFIETVPAYNSLAVYYNPLQIELSGKSIAETVQKLIQHTLNNQTIEQLTNRTIKPTNNQITIPVCYEEEFGIDLKEVSETLQLSVDEIIQRHKNTTYKVFMTGFTPGFPYMGIVDERIITKRKPSPRVKVEAGAVAIAGNQTGIYPLNTPGGWNIIGRTPLKLFNATKENPFKLKAGDEVKFQMITKDEFVQYASSEAIIDREINDSIRPTKTPEVKKQIIQIEQCGFLTTIQDAGRTNYLQNGVSKGGAMDTYSMQLANLLAGNDLSAPVLELTQSPHQFKFLKDTLVAFAGGGLQPQINGTELAILQTHFIKAGTILELKLQIPGFRLYMAVAGGFASNAFLNSYATDLLVHEGGFEGRALKKGDTLSSQNNLTEFQNILYSVLQNGADIKFNLDKAYFQKNSIRVIKGVEWDYLTQEAKEKIANTSFSISPQSSRMGYRLTGEVITANRPCDIISSPVTQGTVQLTSSGELIVLMADAQTVGGYPRVLQVIAADLPILAQKKPGELIQFEMVSLQQAEDAFLQLHLRIEDLQTMIKNMYSE